MRQRWPREPPTEREKLAAAEQAVATTTEAALTTAPAEVMAFTSLRQ